MAFLTSNRVADVLIISAIFALLVVVSPASALVFQSTGKYCSGGKESCTGPSAYRWVSTDSVVTSSVGDGQYLVYFMANEYSTSRSCWAGYTSGWSLSTTCAGNGYKFSQWVDRNNAAYYIYYNPTNDIGAWTGNITAQFSGTPTSGYVPLMVSFTDESAGNPTSWDWNFGDNSTHVTTQNTSHQYTIPGVYTVTLTASKTGSSDSSTRTDYITANQWVAPVASFSCSPTNTTSPDLITCTDSSSNNPTSWLWHLTSPGVSMSPGGSYGAGIYDAVNSTQNPTFLMSGSGMVDVRLTVSNPGGTSQEYKASYITISGDVPTPTPTPAVPWPNQTGICQGSAITLGSGQTRAHAEHYQLTSPLGDTFSGTYPIGMQNYISGYAFFTGWIGQYVYQEYSTVDSTLEWQQSYITEDCGPITTQPTGVTTPYTTVPPYTSYSIPVVTISTFDYSGSTPSTSVDFNVTLPGSISMPTLPSVLPPPPESLNETNFYNITCSGSSPLVAIFCPITTYIRLQLMGFNAAFMFLVFVPFGYIAAILGYMTMALTSFTGAISMWGTGASIVTGIMWNIFQALPAKALNALTVPLIGEFLKEMIDWPEDLQ